METTYILIDHSEKRIVKGHRIYLDCFLSVLGNDPMTIDEFERFNEDEFGFRLFDQGNRPKVPQDISLDTIRKVLGMVSQDPDKVLLHWKHSSYYRDPNYESYSPDQKTDHDIPGPVIDETEACNRRRLNPSSIEPLEIHVGSALICLADDYEKGDITKRISIMRSYMQREGLVLPAIRIRDNPTLDPNEYVFKIYGNEMARGKVKPDKFLAINDGLVKEEIQGTETRDPVENYPSVWIEEHLKSRAESLGYMVVSASAVIAAHLEDVAHEHAEEILRGRKVEIEDPEAYRRSFCGDGIIEADMRTRTIRYITNDALEVDQTVVSNWTVIKE